MDSPSSFPDTCELAQSMAIPWECNFIGVVPLAQGASATLPWSGLLYEPRTMPYSCWYTPNPGGPDGGYCIQGRTPSSGPMQVGVAFFEGADCSDGGAGCYPQGNGLTAIQSFDYPAAGPVEVDIK